MTDRELLKAMYQLLLTEPHVTSLCDKLEGMIRAQLAVPAGVICDETAKVDWDKLAATAVKHERP